MSDTLADDRLFLASSVGFGLIAWGAGFALFAPRGWVGRGAVAAAGALLALGGIALFAPDYLTLAGPVAAAVVLGVTLLGSGRVGGWLDAAARLLGRPRVFGAAVATVAAGGLLAEGWRHDRTLQEESDRTLSVMMIDEAIDLVPAAAVARTDRGTAVPLLLPAAPDTPAGAAAREKNSPAMANLTGQWLRRGPAADVGNCHGWVFTGGRFNLQGRYVTTILADNGYAAVSDPTAGDVCVYRNSEGEVTHTGLVRTVLGDGTVLVESKWGRLGVYLHAVGGSCYGTDFTYHRTARTGHLLAGLNSSTDADAKVTNLPAP